MRHKEPQSTLCWTAWHIFDRLFSAKYETGKLTMNEYCELINTAITRRQAHIAKNRKWYELRLRWSDRVFLHRCQRMLEILQPKKDIKPPQVKTTSSPEVKIQEFMRSHSAFSEQAGSYGKRFGYKVDNTEVAHIWFKYGLNGWNLIFYERPTEGRVHIDSVEKLKNVLKIETNITP